MSAETWLNVIVGMLMLGVGFVVWSAIADSVRAYRLVRRPDDGHVHSTVHSTCPDGVPREANRNQTQGDLT